MADDVAAAAPEVEVEDSALFAGDAAAASPVFVSCSFLALVVVVFSCRLEEEEEEAEDEVGSRQEESASVSAFCGCDDCCCCCCCCCCSSNCWRCLLILWQTSNACPMVRTIRMASICL